MVFISHSTKDKSIALEIKTALDRAGYQPWVYEDPSPQSSHSDFISRMQEAIEISPEFVLLISRSALDSYWVDKELSQQAVQGKFLIPVLIGMTEEEFKHEINEPERGKWRFLLGCAIWIPYSEKAAAEIIAILTHEREKNKKKDSSEVEDFLRTKKIEIIEWHPSGKMFLAKWLIGQSRHFIWFFCPNRPVKPQDVEELIKLVTNTRGAEGWIVTDQLIDITAKELVEANQGLLQYTTVANFYREMLRYDGYLNNLIKEVDSEIKPFWVDLKCVDEENGLFDVREYVDKWLNNPQENLLALLGDLGTGKTWFCKYFAAHLAQQHLEKPDQYRVPILISMSEWKEIRNIEAHIIYVLTKIASMDMGTYEAFMHLNQRGRLLLIFDGFDEMELRVEERVAMENFRRISAATGSSKVIINSRLPFFNKTRPFLDVMKPSLGNPGMRTVTLQAFNDNQIQQALEKRIPGDAQKWWNQISKIDRLKDVAQRPVMIEVISKASLSMEMEHVDSAKLYRNCITEGWIKKGCSVTDKQTEEHMFAFLRDLACETFGQQAGGTVAQDEFLKSADENSDSYNLVNRLTRLLIRDQGTGKYTFPHTSFIEFFVADRIAEELSIGNIQEFFRYRMTDGVTKFMKDIACSNPKVMQGIIQAMYDALPGDQMNLVVQILIELSRDDKDPGKVNPILSVVESLNTSDQQDRKTPPYIVAAFGKQEYLDSLKTDNLSLMARYFLLDLWGSPNITSESAVRYLTEAMRRDPDFKVQRRAAEVVGQRRGEQELQALIQAIGDLTLPLELRKHCITSIPNVALKGGPIGRQFINALRIIIFSDHDDLSFKTVCLNSLAYSGLREASQLLLTIIQDYMLFETDMWVAAVYAISQTHDLAVAEVIDSTFVDFESRLPTHSKDWGIRLLIGAARSIRGHTELI